MKRKFTLGDFGIYALLGLIAAVMLYPLLNVISVSLSSENGYANHPLMIFPHDFDASSYRWILTHHLILSSYQNTLIITVGGTIISMFLTATLAYPLSVLNLKGRKPIMALIVFTMFFNGGMIPNYYLVRSLDMIDTLWALMIPGALSVYNMILMKNSFEGIPASLKESAYIDGANDLVIVFRIILPLIMPTIAVLLLYYGVGHWNAWFNASIYLQDNTKLPIQNVLRAVLIANSNILNAAAAENDKVNEFAEAIKYAAIVLTTVPVLCIYPFLQKYFVKGVMVGAVKG